MSLIDKGTLPTQLQTILDGLNLPSTRLARVVTLLKTAINAGADTTALAAQIQSYIAGGTRTQLTDVTLLILASNLISDDMSISVPSLEELTNIAPGSVFTLQSSGIPYVKKSDGTWIVIDPSLHPKLLENAYGWGSNSVGQLGDNTATSRLSPVSVVGGFTDWVQISAGDNHTAAVRANGTAWAWGSNGQGRLGDDTTTNRSSPVSVVGGFTDWAQIEAGGSHTAAIRANGTAWAWGFNGSGRLGDGTTIYQSSPVSVIGGFTDWVQISAGSYHTAAIRANGTAWTWGSNGKGRLGDNTTTNQSSPVSVVGDFADWVQISAGSYHTAAVRANGTAWVWGSNGQGQLGDNTTVSKSSPVSVVGGFTDWVQISAGDSHTAAVRANGTAWAWGYNGQGQLGDVTTATRSSPVSVVGGFTDWVEISASILSHTTAIRANGTAWAWGSNLRGQLGDNTTVSKSSPVSVVGGFTDWVQISAGSAHTAAIRGSN